ncbi:MAG: hypothetical protein ACK5HR_06125 [Mycoplasmatales bacterium]
MALRARAMRYNIINISSIIIFPLLFILQFELGDWMIILLDDDTLAVLLGWPIFLMIGIIVLNKKSIKEHIHKESIPHYTANNIKVDLELDNGSISSYEQNLLPDFLQENKKRRKVIKKEFDLFASGKLDDLQISYKIDKFEYVVGERKMLDTDYQTIFSYKGDVFKIEYEKVYFGDSPIIFMNNSMLAGCKKAEFKVHTRSLVPNLGYLLYDEDKTDKQVVDDLCDIIIQEIKVPKKAKEYIIFFENRLIYFTNTEHKYKIKVPFLIHKNKLESLLSDQKGQIYRFNMLLNKIANIFHNKK